MKREIIDTTTESYKDGGISPAFIELHFMLTTDVQALYGCHIKTAQKLLRNVRISFKKKPKSPISLEEFAAYTGISLKMLDEFKKVRHK